MRNITEHNITEAVIARFAGCSDPRLKELTDEIVRISTEFGILTEYTAFLAREGTDAGIRPVPGKNFPQAPHVRERRQPGSGRRCTRHTGSRRHRRRAQRS